MSLSGTIRSIKHEIGKKQKQIDRLAGDLAYLENMPLKSGELELVTEGETDLLNLPVLKVMRVNEDGIREYEKTNSLEVIREETLLKIDNMPDVEHKFGVTIRHASLISLATAEPLTRFGFEITSEHQARRGGLISGHVSLENNRVVMRRRRLLEFAQDMALYAADLHKAEEWAKSKEKAELAVMAEE